MDCKKRAGEKAVEYIQDGMIIGLGTGSTVYHTIVKLSEKVKEGLNIKAVSTSSSTTKLAQQLGISVVPFNKVDYVQKIEDLYALEKMIRLIPGVVDTGLFLNIADTIIIGRENTVEIISK
ncbi:ribose-5-phosphate isomerase A [Clostridium sp.]|uniref:ribose-5-phosphate isomerase A n=1 Tax=Clostridium sp. TaxID=1506 RepID=UPI003F4BB060